MKIIYLLFVPITVFLGLNYRQLYSAWAIKSETKRLVNVAANASDEFQNPAPMEDWFEGKLSSDFGNLRPSMVLEKFQVKAPGMRLISRSKRDFSSIIFPIPISKTKT